MAKIAITPVTKRGQQKGWALFHHAGHPGDLLAFLLSTLPGKSLRHGVANVCRDDHDAARPASSST